MMTPGSDPIVSFYRGGRDSAGRTLAEILAWDDDRLEAVHDYIQWVFPTRQPSGVNPDAPLVSDRTAEAFATDPALRDALLRALDRMLTFYGCRRNGARIEMDPARFLERARTWLRPGNHNHLRLTRIMQSLSALGLPDEARGLQRCLLEDVADGPGGGLVTGRTRQFWKTAV
jgi:opioid growth factor receptor-like protein